MIQRNKQGRSPVVSEFCGRSNPGQNGTNNLNQRVNASCNQVGLQCWWTDNHHNHLMPCLCQYNHRFQNKATLLLSALSVKGGAWGRSGGATTLHICIVSLTHESIFRKAVFHSLNRSQCHHSSNEAQHEHASWLKRPRMSSIASQCFLLCGLGFN